MIPNILFKPEKRVPDISGIFAAAISAPEYQEKIILDSMSNAGSDMPETIEVFRFYSTSHHKMTYSESG
jgi:hypothetical protein